MKLWISLGCSKCTVCLKWYGCQLPGLAEPKEWMCIDGRMGCPDCHQSPRSFPAHILDSGKLVRRCSEGGS